LKLFKFLAFSFFKSSGALLTFSYIFLSTKVLSPTEYGILALLITLINLGGAVLSFGIPAYLFEIMSSKKHLKKFNEKIKLIFIIIFSISFFFLLIANYYSNFISIWFFKNNEYSFAINLLGLLIFFAILNRIFSSYFIATKKYYVSTIGDNFLFPFFILIFLLISFILKDINFSIFIKYILFLMPIISLYYLFFIKINFTFLNIKTTLKKYKEFLKPCFDLTIVSISGIILISSDIIILGILSEPTSVSNYHIATKVSSVIALILASSMSFYYGKSLKLFKENNIKALRKQISKINYYSLLIGLFSLIFIALTYNQIVTYFFYNINILILKKLIFILCFGQFVNVIFGYQGSLLIIIPRYRKIVSYIFLFTVLFNILTSIYAFYLFGALGIAVATMLSIILRELLISYFFTKHYGFHPLSYIKSIFIS
jgi:O-antigen/teichoic acid export membrane protein